MGRMLSMFYWLVFFQYFNFLASNEFFLIAIFYILITRLKIKIPGKTHQQNSDNDLPLKDYYM
jgi:hypothetical protein